MATLTVYPDPGSGSTTCDGFVSKGDSNNWQLTHDSTTGNGYQVSDTESWICLTSKSSNFTIIRGNASFDTSSLGTNSTISSAVISFCSTGQAKSNVNSTSVNIVASTQANSNNLSTSDYNKYGTTVFGTKNIADFVDTLGTYNDIILNASGIATVSKTGITMFGIRTGLDISDSEPSTGENRVYAYFADQALTSKDPKLVITYTSVAVVTTESVTDIDFTTATGNGTVVSDGGETITERGVCWKTSTGPTTADSKATSTGTLGAFTATITGLTAGTTYYVKAYCVNAFGTFYGDEVTFTTTSLNSLDLVKDVGGVDDETYAVSINATVTTGTLTVKFGTTGYSQVISSSGVTVMQGLYGGLSGLIITQSLDFTGTVDDIMWVLVLGDVTIDWTKNTLTNLYLIDSSVTFKRIEDKEVTRFNVYRYIDVSFKDLDAYVKVTVTDEANDLSYNSVKTFIVGGTVGAVSPFVKKRISMLLKSQAILVGFSNAKLNETFTICEYSVSGFKEPKKLYAPSKIISI